MVGLSPCQKFYGGRCSIPAPLVPSFLFAADFPFLYADQPSKLSDELRSDILTSTTKSAFFLKILFPLLDQQPPTPFRVNNIAEWILADLSTMQGEFLFLFSLHLRHYLLGQELR